MLKVITLDPEDVFFLWLPSKSRKFIEFVHNNNPSYHEAIAFLHSIFVPTIKENVSENKIYDILNSFALIHTPRFTNTILLNPITAKDEFWASAIEVHDQVMKNYPQDILSILPAEPVKIENFIFKKYPVELTKFCQALDTNVLCDLLIEAITKNIVHIREVVTVILLNRDLSLFQLKNLAELDYDFASKFRLNDKLMNEFLTSNDALNPKIWQFFPDSLLDYTVFLNLLPLFRNIEISKLKSIWLDSPNLRETINQVLIEREHISPYPSQLAHFIENSSTSKLINWLQTAPKLESILISTILKRKYLTLPEKAQIFLINKEIRPILINQEDFNDPEFWYLVANLVSEELKLKRVYQL